MLKTVDDIEGLKKRLPHLIINQKSFQIANRSQLLTPMKGFWDVHAAVVQDTLAVNEEGEHGINLGYTI